MRLLVVDPSSTERETTLRLLRPDHHEARAVASAKDALRLLETETFDVVLVEATMRGPTGNELVKRIRAHESTGHLYIVVTASHGVTGDLKTAFAVGADDFVRKPIDRDELAARVDGPNRVRRWAHVREAPAAPAGPAASAPAPLTSKEVWTRMDVAIAATLSELLGTPLAPARAADGLGGATLAAAIPLSLAAQRYELRVAIGVDEGTADLLAQAMYGDASVDAEAREDMMKEIANIAGGALKRVAAEEGLAFTTHVPVRVEAARFGRPDATARRRFQLSGDGLGAPATLRFDAELGPLEAKLVRVAALREGMVVAEDLRTPRGALLMRSGMRVTESAASGLASVLGADALVEVLEAA